MAGLFSAAQALASLREIPAALDPIGRGYLDANDPRPFKLKALMELAGNLPALVKNITFFPI